MTPLTDAARRRIASQARAVARSGADVNAMRRALEFLAGEVLEGGCEVAAPDLGENPIRDRRQRGFRASVGARV